MLSGDKQMSLMAAARLAQLGHEDGRAFLRERIRQPGSEQLVAARFLAAPDAPEVAELFRQVLRDQRAGASARVLASEGLGSCGQLLDARLLGGQLKAHQEASVAVSAASSIVVLAKSEPGRLSEQSLAWARSALSDGEWTVRESAVAVIGEMITPDAVPLLTTLLKDHHPAVRRSAVRALGRRREESALPALQIGLQDADGSVREESLRALLQLSQHLPSTGDIGQTLKDKAGSWVQSLIAKGSESEQTLARALLLRLGDASQVAKLHELSRSADATVRRLVIEQLARDLELLADMLKDPVFAVRFAAAKQLAEANDRRGIAVLKESVERKGPESYSAIALLRKMGETLLVPDGLVEELGSGTVADRLSVLNAMSAQAGESMVLLLRRMARDLDPQVRRRTAEVAAELPVAASGHPGIPILRLLATDSDSSVRARAVSLLSPLLTTTKPPAPPPALPPASLESPPNLPADKAQVSLPAKTAVGGSSAPDKPVDEPVKNVPADNPVPEQATGSGTLIVEAASIVQFQLDHGRWQTPSKRGLVLAAGRHELVSLSGTQQITIEDGKTVTIKITESQVEKLINSGLEAHEKKDLRKAQKLFEKANSLCNRERKYPQPCNELLIDINYHLGQIHEAVERFPEAVSSYQKVVQGSSRTHEEQKNAAQEAMKRLLPNLGQVVIPKTVKNHCQEVTLFMIPGTHMIDIDGNQQTVKVRARETVKLGSCE
jgi:HEAT repeat protein